MYCLDRFEGNYAVIEFVDENGIISFIKEDKTAVSPETKEGDALILENGVYKTDTKLTKYRRKLLRERLNKLGL